MAEILSLRHERIDDVPLIIGVANQLGMGKILNSHLGTHGLQQGLNNGQLAVGWLGYILSQADHRKSAVREWANAMPDTLERLLCRPIREVDFSDDRLGGVLRRLSDDQAWEAIERDLWAATLTVFEVPLSGVRLDSTTTYGYHRPSDDGLMQYGHSKDHRPDLPQLKLMAAAAQPLGHLLACDVLAGQCADDPLYTPLIRRVRSIVGRSGLLYVGDCKMAALATRAELAFHQDYYLTPLPLTGDTAHEFEAWLTAVVDGQKTATLIWDGGCLLGAGYEFQRSQATTLKDTQGVTQTVSWTERVQVFRSLALWQSQQETQEKRLTAASAALRALTPKPGRGKRPIRDQTALHQAVNKVLKRYDVAGLLTVTWQRHETSTTRCQGRGRPGPKRPIHTQTQVHYVICDVQRNQSAIAAYQRRLGWRAQVTNTPVDVLPLSQAILHYREGWVLERDFHIVKDLPLGLSPLFVWKDDQIKGLVRLLTLALRLLTLIESQVRQGLAKAQQTMSGLYEGQPKRQTNRPTAKRILCAFAKAHITLTHIETNSGTIWHITPLSPLHEQILNYLHAPASLYSAPVYNSS